jgi:hypothetical protein
MGGEGRSHRPTAEKKMHFRGFNFINRAANDDILNFLFDIAAP